jgi:hypothetical protein
MFGPTDRRPINYLGVIMMKIKSICLIVSLSMSTIGYTQSPADFQLVGEQSQVWQRNIQPTDDLKYGPTPADAINLAIADMGTLSDQDRPFQRYIWIPDGDDLKESLVNYAVNLAASRASIIVHPAVVADGRLLRYDLRALAPASKDYAQIHALWEQLAFEPYFHITKSNFDAIPVNATILDNRPDDPTGSIRYIMGDQLFFKGATGQVFSFNKGRWAKQNEIPVQRIVTYGSHVGLEQGVMLQGLSKSNAAVVRYDFFIVKTLTSADGGMYYQFAGIEKEPSEGTAQEAFFNSLGASEQLVQQLRSDQRIAMFRSNVTGKPRRIDAFYGVSVRPGSGTGLITMTHDTVDNDVDPRSDPIRNLLNINDQAREVIAEKPNGMHIFALFDGEGALQDEVPPNIAVDHTVPQPYTRRIQSAISCIRCHGPDNGLKPFRNEVQIMLSGLLDAFGDTSSSSSVPDQLDRLAGLYAGDLQKPINRARDDYNDAVYRATGGMGVVEASAQLSNVFSDYIYTQIDAFRACYELGYLVPSDQAAYYLSQLLPPLPTDELGISPEDPVIGALKAGLKVNRLQWEQVYADAAFRVLQTRKSQENISRE